MITARAIGTADRRIGEAVSTKLVYPQPSAMPGRFAMADFAHFFLQSMDGPELAENTAAAIEYGVANRSGG